MYIATSLFRYRHPNLIVLMGYCKNPPALVYPYMQRGSLYKNLHEWKVGTVHSVSEWWSMMMFQVEEPISWHERHSILLETCRGLAYLHSEEPPVVHHDVNS